MNCRSPEEEIRVTRGTFKPNSNILIARGYGKRDDMPRSDGGNPITPGPIEKTNTSSDTFAYYLV